MDMYQLTQVRHRFLKNLWKWYFLSGTEHIFGMDDDEYTGVFEVSYIWFESQNHDPPCSFITTNITLYDRYQRNCNISAAQWWSTYFVALMKAIEVRPSRETVFKFTEEAYYEALADANSCAICRVHAVRHLDAFREYFGRNLDEIVMQTIGEFEFRTP
ncbi:hypothetical protein M413DRAFT_353820 [Hebeloma cylindrosporum]|uniref:Uncharacterized protein n=1 Tax=Hebeloma cylindrosporum TaxID=76867 RepID=A0A0C3CKZ5_HEBCY|nr:hypothetical protein M413DRAFT_353820 [Hebeloma cylindrosporum h7]